MQSGLFLAALLSGFYAGTGFFIAMGGNPAIELMSDRTFAEYWQHTDHFMAARMKIFGPLLLLTLVSCVVMLARQYRSISFWLMLTAAVILIVDVIFTFSTNLPLNHLVQAWDINQLPPNVQEVKEKVVQAFHVRKVFMIGAFIVVLLAAWMNRTKPAT